MVNRISVLTEATAPDASKPILAQLKQGLGKTPNLFATIAHSPGSLKGLLAWDVAAGKLGQRELELTPELSSASAES